MNQTIKFFALGAYNPTPTARTQLSTRCLDPKNTKDREALQTIFREPGVSELMSNRCLRFGLADSLLLAPGRQRVFLDPLDPKAEGVFAVPLAPLGAVNEKEAYTLVAVPGRDCANEKGQSTPPKPGTNNPLASFEPVDAPRKLHLGQGEIWQMFARVVLGDPKTAVVVQFVHEALPPEGGPILIGKFNTLFVPDYDPFAGCQ